MRWGFLGVVLVVTLGLGVAGCGRHAEKVGGMEAVPRSARPSGDAALESRVSELERREDDQNARSQEVLGSAHTAIYVTEMVLALLAFLAAAGGAYLWRRLREALARTEEAVGKATDVQMEGERTVASLSPLIHAGLRGKGPLRVLGEVEVTMQFVQPSAQEDKIQLNINTRGPGLARGCRVTWGDEVSALQFSAWQDETVSLYFPRPAGMPVAAGETAADPILVNLRDLVGRTYEFVLRLQARDSDGELQFVVQCESRSVKQPAFLADLGVD